MGKEENTEPTETPSLLVSVRNIKEARLLRGCGCDIIDVKEPANGPLGKADDETIASIADALPADVTMSVALGELSELPDTVHVSDSVSYLKLGLANVTANWRERWQAAREKIEAAQDSKPRWVAVAYADHEAAAAPSPNAVLQAAIETDCRVLLVDTFEKVAGRSVFDCLSVERLTTLREHCERHGLLFALAGQLRIAHADKIRQVAPHIVGIRGAACRGASRTAAVDPEAVRDFQKAISANQVRLHRV